MPGEEKKAISIEVPSKGGVPPTKEEEELNAIEKQKELKKIDGAVLDDSSEELSDEDKELKENLELQVERIQDSIEGVALLALDTLASEIKSATSSMTSVPKPLKFLRPHYAALLEYQKSCTFQKVQVKLADVVSVLSMTMAEPGSRATLKYKLAGDLSDLSTWGHEYVRHLAGEVGLEFQERQSQEPPLDTQDLDMIIDQIAPFNLQHNAESECIDLLLEVSQLPKLLKLEGIDVDNYPRICLYLLRTSDYMPDAEDLDIILECAYQIFKRFDQCPDALRVALKMSKEEYVKELFDVCKDPLVRKQMGYVLGRQRHFSYWLEDDVEDADEINDKIGNGNLSSLFLALAQDLDVMEPKTPENIYKSHLSETGTTGRGADGANVESAKQNAASTYVNAFVNCGFCVDGLISKNGTTSNEWLFKNRELGMLSAAASLGMIYMWNMDEGYTAMEPFTASDNSYIKAGGVLGIGMVSAGSYQPEFDQANGFLADYLENTGGMGTRDFTMVRNMAIMAYGLAYAGAAREDIWEMMMPMILDESATANMETVTLSALTSGMTYVGTSNEDASITIAQKLMGATETEMNMSITRLLPLSLGLLYLGKQDDVEGILEILKTITHPIGAFAVAMVEGCAYAGTGNVLMVQKMLHMCAEHLEDEADAVHQISAVISIALIAIGDQISIDMVMRTFDHLLQYGDRSIKRAIPLAIALLYISNPDYSVVDNLSRLTHDADEQTAQAAILALGLVGAGTNNSRVAGLLRQLSSFYSKEAKPLFVVRLAQGLLHMGKGLQTISPHHSDKLLINNVSLGAILIVIYAATDMNNTISDKYHYLMYWLASAICPRMLITVDEEGEVVPVAVRVGQAVEIVGQAGRPKTISGFQKLMTPVLLQADARAELATEEYTAMATVLEGTVVIKKNLEVTNE